MDFLDNPVFRLTLLFLAAALILIALKRTEPSWRISLIRGAFLGGLLLCLAPLTGLRLEVPGWKATPFPARVLTEPDSGLAAKTAALTPAPETGTASSPNPPPRFRLLPGLWLGIASLLFLRLAFILTKEQLRLNSAETPPASTTRIWNEVCAEFGVKSKGIIVVTEPVSPHLSLDGKLVLPAVLLSDSDETLIHIFRHEAAHLRAGDHFWFPFLSVLTAILWFHPLAWWLAERHLVACEEARDAEAARRGGLDAYRRSVAGVALGLLPTATASPSLVRKNCRLLGRLQRVERISLQSPPVASALLALQSALVLIALVTGIAAPDLKAALKPHDLTGLWNPTDAENRFAAQLEIYEWGGEIKLRIWPATGTPQHPNGATITSFHMTPEEFETALSENNSISVAHNGSFQESIYTLSKHDSQLEFRLQSRYTDDSNRADQDLVFYYRRSQRSP